MSISDVSEEGRRIPVAGLVTALLFLVVCLSWGTTWLGIKIAVESVPPLTAAGLRFLIAFPLFLLFAAARRAPIFFPRRHRAFFVFVALGYFSVPYYLLNYGEQYVASGLTALLFSTMPVFILIFSALFLKERIFLSQIAGIAVGFGSLFMIIKSQGLHLDYSELLGAVAVLAAAVMHALVYVITKQRGADIGVITFNTLPIGIAGLGLFVTGLLVEHPDLSLVTANSWAALAYLGLAASVGGFIVYFFLLKRLSPIVLSFVFIIFPVFAIVIGTWYEGAVVSLDLVGFTTLLLVGFAITKLPVEKLLGRKT
ncbi:DMT family transporter [Castellaniella defragrans]|uniref:Drug/metabolite transporter (DMT)-like permease n=1 Tax=Castellaniella defragrans TaxID=75697 RepID=A0A7W9TNM8_CASDE|nr:DMT family transporter [Castellaniella defragrans]MBB6083666.1 drug/metabolite transporter (DMT)-like permease [Castellaniella defragrans]